MHNGEYGLIEGVEVFPQPVFPDERGRVYRGVRKSEDRFHNFPIEEVYCSLVYPGAVKAWHLHQRMTLNYFVPVGNIKLALYDNRPDSPTFNQLDELFLGENCPHAVVRVPPGVWNGFMAVDGRNALVVNITDLEHDPSEIVRMSPIEFYNKICPYDWQEGRQG